MSHLFSVVFGFVASLGLSALAISVAGPLRLLDVPEGRRQHTHPTARVGGLGIILALLLNTAVVGLVFPLSHVECFAVLAMAFLGLMDDRFDLRARWKAMLGLAVAIVLAYGSTHAVLSAGQEIRILDFVVPLLFMPIFILLALMYWALPHAFNLIDGANGLATGYGLIVLGSLWLAGFPYYFLMGSLLACLGLNWPRARLFLGDTGSLSLGLLLTLLVFKAVVLSGPNHILWVFAYPIVDVTMVVVIRLLLGRKISLGDRSHLHFQIIDRWPHMDLLRVPFLWLLAAMCASEVYLKGGWLILPWVGLAMLSGTALLLGAMSVWSARTRGRCPSVEPCDEDGIASASGGHFAGQKSQQSHSEMRR